MIIILRGIIQNGRRGSGSIRRNVFLQIYLLSIDRVWNLDDNHSENAQGNYY